jgi:flagella basal body P-ring formation protein FlgA
MTRRLLQPVVVIAAIALALFTARLAGAQSASPVAPTHRIAVATRALPRGVVLLASDFELRDTTMRGTPDTTKVVAGWTTRSSIVAGEVLRSPMVEPPVVVNANASVQVEYTDAGITLTMRGIAARNGSLGDRVPVRVDSGKRLEGTVIAPGRIRID